MRRESRCGLNFFTSLDSSLTLYIMTKLETFSCHPLTPYTCALVVPKNSFGSSHYSLAHSVLHSLLGTTMSSCFSCTLVCFLEQQRTTSYSLHLEDSKSFIIQLIIRAIIKEKHTCQYYSFS